MDEWREQLGSFFKHQEKQNPEKPESGFAVFLTDVALPAFEQVAEEMRRYGREVLIRRTDTSASLRVDYAGAEEFMYRIQGRMFPSGIVPFAEIRYRQRRGLRIMTAESMIRSGNQTYPLSDVTQAEIIQNFLMNYTQRVKSD